MKKITVKLISALLLTALAVSIAGCAAPDVYEQLSEEGYTVKVTYDTSGAMVNNTQGIQIIELYREDDIVNRGGKSGILLIDPANEGLRKTDTAGIPRYFALSLTKKYSKDLSVNFSHVGWYRTRALRTDDAGRALDDFGELCSVSNRDQAYVYSDPWDFTKDLLDPATLENGEFTLYAAFVPYFNFEFYDISNGAPVLIGSHSGLNLDIPVLDEDKGIYKMKDFPKPEEGKMFAGAWLDAARQIPLTENIKGKTDYVDMEKGIATTYTVKIYTAWEAK